MLLDIDLGPISVLFYEDITDISTTHVTQITLSYSTYHASNNIETYRSVAKPPVPFLKGSEC
jgi:hypothetical protein